MRPCHGRDRGFESRRLRQSTSYRYGAIAQLGERLNRTQEVRGSTPLSSTKRPPERNYGRTGCAGSSVDRVPDYESGGRRFESCPARQYWRGVRVVEGAALEMLCTGNRTEGSNPSLSATTGPETIRPSNSNRAVAQLGSALPWGGRGRGFKSRQPDH